MKTIKRQGLNRPVCLAACAIVGLLSPLTWAQPVDSSGPATRPVGPSGVAAFATFGQWVQASVPVEPSNFFVERAESLTWATPAGSASAYQPTPVILGAPELPLQAHAGQPNGVAWTPQNNYQGMRVRFVVLDSSGRQAAIRPVSEPPRGGERFRIRVTPTFEAVASIDMVSGPQWQRQRLGQVWPQPGFSVQVRPGETAEVPLQAGQYFVMPAAEQALVLSVRHAQALGAARSTQPAYRLDSTRGSDYLQLITAGQVPAIEQLITAAR